STRKAKPDPLPASAAINHQQVDSIVSAGVTVPQGTPPLAMMESTGSLGSDVQSPVNPMPPPASTTPSSGTGTATGSNNNNASVNAGSSTTTTSTSTTSLQHVPQSPRGIDQKIKRPQVPAPPPPVGRPKSSDSTDL
uniref:Uncharacterized protein n=1 Tax=Anopheles maculatus TaxID=74869 RepID=A0A182SGV4_9DIPT